VRVERKVREKTNGGIEMRETKSTRAVMAILLCLTIGLAGCSTAWISQAEQIVAAMIPAAANLLTLVAALQGKTISATDLQTIQTAATQAGEDLQLIQSLIAAYEKADATAQPGILNQIESAIVAAQGSLEGLLPALHIKDTATQAKVTAVVGILLSEVQSMAAILPVAARISTLAAKNAASIGHPKPALSAGEFVASYNATITAKTGNADLDRATAGLKIHEHGMLARVVTAGMLR
jgi:hypothetical protein